MSKEFIWDDEKVEKYAETHQFQSMEDFKKQFSPEPEWKIVAYREPGKIGKVIKETSYSWNYAVKNWIIFSVKRISDSEIFSIGDLHKSTLNMRKDWPPCKITKFIIADDGTMITENDGNCRNPLHQIEKVKESIPLFTTEDNVPVFEGMEYWYVSCNSWKLLKCGPAKINAVDVADGWFFSTKEAAEDYIVVYKPCLSIWDIACSTIPASAANSLMDQLKSIVKIKIKTDQ